MIDIEVMPDSSEIIRYDFSAIPLAVQDRLLSSYSGMKALCHWHQDIECLYIREGEMYYDVNGKKILLNAGDSIFINSHQLHFGFSHHQRECKFIVVIFHPDLLRCNNYMYQKFVVPIIETPSLPYIYFAANSPNAEPVADIITQLLAARKEKSDFYEYEYYAAGLLYSLWSILYQCVNSQLPIETSDEDPNITIQKKMVSYIYQHYSETLTLENIARAGNVCRSKCCKIFQMYLQQSPIDFLNTYRLVVSRNLLKDSSYSIAQIATHCGYNHLSYFSKMFRMKYGCTPNQFRKSVRTQ